MAITEVRARVSGRVKDEAAAVLATMGLTVSDALHLLLVRVAKEKALPFEPLRPNSRTARALKEARKGKLKRFASVKDLLADLNAKN
jgi:DNA-damage-inducible protein J